MVVQRATRRGQLTLDRFWGALGRAGGACDCREVPWWEPIKGIPASPHPRREQYGLTSDQSRAAHSGGQAGPWQASRTGGRGCGHALSSSAFSSAADTRRWHTTERLRTPASQLRLQRDQFPTTQLRGGAGLRECAGEGRPSGGGPGISSSSPGASISVESRTGLLLQGAPQHTPGTSPPCTRAGGGRCVMLRESLHPSPGSTVTLILELCPLWLLSPRGCRRHPECSLGGHSLWRARLRVAGALPLGELAVGAAMVGGHRRAVQLIAALHGLHLAAWGGGGRPAQPHRDQQRRPEDRCLPPTAPRPHRRHTGPSTWSRAHSARSREAARLGQWAR